MASRRELTFDAWTPLSFKNALDKPRYGPPSWVGDHGRRLQAYTILRAYVDNNARAFLSDDVSERDRAQHREYGDPALLVHTAAAALMGEEQTVRVEGAGGSAEDEDHDPAADALQEWMDGWADRERLTMKLIEVERDAVGIGDGVYALGWDAGRRRPRLRVYDPGFYFPVLDDGNEDEFPTTVHVAWEVESDETNRTMLRRITWRLGPTPDGVPRRYPWSDEPVDLTCYLTDATWKLPRFGPNSVDDLDLENAEFAVDADGEVRDRDLAIDFVPVVHVPNTIAGKDHYGTSVLARVLQILDDVANADTDLQAAAGTTGTPPIALSGASLGGQKIRYRPGEVLEVGENGRLDVVDTSRSLAALSEYVSNLLQRLSVNSRLPSSILGRVEPSEVPSGIALLLSFGPFKAMINEMRLVRSEKYTLLLKFAWRMALAGNAPDVPTEWRQAGVEFGAYLPEDRAGTVSEVVKLLGQKAISTETAVRMLVEAGLSIDDATEEVKRIRAEDFGGATDLLEATGDEDAVFEYLGREAPGGGTAPTPPGGGTETE